MIQGYEYVLQVLCFTVACFSCLLQAAQSDISFQWSCADPLSRLERFMLPLDTWNVTNPMMILYYLIMLLLPLLPSIHLQLVCSHQCWGTSLCHQHYVMSWFIPSLKGLRILPDIATNYRGIALASSLSKVLEWSILLTWKCYFRVVVTCSLDLLCTGVMKAVINRYLNRGSNVYICMLDWRIKSLWFDWPSYSVWQSLENTQLK